MTDLRDKTVDVTFADGSFRIEKDGAVTERTIVKTNDGTGYADAPIVGDVTFCFPTSPAEPLASDYLNPIYPNLKDIGATISAWKERMLSEPSQLSPTASITPNEWKDGWPYGSDTNDAATQRANALADECGRLKSELDRVTKERDHWEARARRAEGRK